MSFLINFFSSCKLSIDFGHLSGIKEKALKDPVKHTCTDVAREVFSFLSATDLESCRRVNKEWQKITVHEALQKKVFLNTFVFGREKWKTYYGDVGAEPPLPLNLEALLASQCPYFPGKRVFQTHMLVLIPKTINGEPYNLKSIVELVKKKPRTGQKTGFRYFCKEILEDHGNKSVNEAQWVLMTKDVIPKSNNTRFADQQALIQLIPNYRIPMLLEAVTCILAEYLSTGIRRFNGGDVDIPWSPWTYTRCQETIGGWQTMVGGFLSAGIAVDYYSGYTYQSIGTAALRKF